MSRPQGGPVGPRADAGALQREAQRQQALLGALWRRAPDNLAGWLAGDAGAQAAGLAAYRGNASAVAERALGAAYPTVRLLLGDESFAMLARALWHAQPPQRGDLACWGDGLPAFVAADPQLAGEPYLADVARVDEAVHCAGSAADPAPAAGGAGPVLPPGAALIDSPWPVATLWQAHHRAPAGADPFAAAREALAARRGEHALVWRDQGVVQVTALDAQDAQVVRELLAPHPSSEETSDAPEP